MATPSKKPTQISVRAVSHRIEGCEDVHKSRSRGLRGVRVGEASNLGLESGHEVRVEDSAYVDPTQVDPHEEAICVSQGSVAVAVPSEG